MDDSRDLLVFDDFVLDLNNRELRRRGAAVGLGSRYFDALVLLVSEAGSLVSKDRFMQNVWRGIPVTDEALTQCIRTLRQVLQDDARAPRYIATVPKQGYRFLVIPDANSIGADRRSGAPARSTDAGRTLVGAAAFGGTLAGALGGLFYALVGTTHGASLVPVLTLIIAALGLLAGAGVGLGMAIARSLQPRGRWMFIVGGALGGVAVGALGEALGTSGVGLLTGTHVGPVTGLFEGLILGSAVGLVAACIDKVRPNSATSIVLPFACLIGGVAGWLLDAADGRLLGGSLLTLEEHLRDTRIGLARVGAAVGDDGFGRLSRTSSATIEGALFVGCIAVTLLFAWRRDPDEGREQRN